MQTNVIKTSPIPGQKTGTAGLRKSTREYMKPNYLENFLQSCMNARKSLGHRLETLVVGGDGRYPGREFLPRIVRLLVANGVKRVLVVGSEGGDFTATTPAISHIIRKYGTDGGFVLSASHNPAGPDGDFGIKVELGNGGGAPESVTSLIAEEAERIAEYYTTDEDIGPYIEYVDPVKDYVELLQSMFDFDAIKAWFDAGHTFRFDAMNAASGPVARAIFEGIFNLPSEWLLRCDPMDDFGGIHPEPNPTYAKEFYDMMMGGVADFGAAEDGDGDRNMVMGRGFYLAPSDCLAVMAKYHRLVPYFRGNFKGVARSRPTSCAVDAVAKAGGFPIFATPTGWKWFGNLLDAGLISLCGEESFGQGGDHIREKDGTFAVLYWLNIMGATGLSLEELAREMWEEGGRVFYSQYSYEGVDEGAAQQLLKHAAAVCERFDYEDPATGEFAKDQGFETHLADGTRVFFRLSGTGTIGATLRFYVERVEDNPELFGASSLDYFAKTRDGVSDLFRLRDFFGPSVRPTSIT